MLTPLIAGLSYASFAANLKWAERSIVIASRQVARRAPDDGLREPILAVCGESNFWEVTPVAISAKPRAYAA